MIETTFMHIPGVGRRGEIQLWKSGITRWKKAIATPSHPNFGKKMWQRIRQEAAKCQKKLDEKDYEFFAENFPEEVIWRMIANLRGKILYFDLEATGLDPVNDQITTIATWDGNEIRVFIRGENLDEFPEYLEDFYAICTFYGTDSDLPMLEKQLGVHCEEYIHFDLFYISRHLGLKGGLKELEKKYKISRGNLTGIKGDKAIWMWNKYKETGEKKYLDTLIAYNIEDILHLEDLLVIFYNEIKKKYGLPVKSLPLPSDQTWKKALEKLNIKADPRVIEEILNIEKKDEK